MLEFGTNGVQQRSPCGSDRVMLCLKRRRRRRERVELPILTGAIGVRQKQALSY